MLSYLASGAVAAAVFARHGSIQWAMVGWLCLGAIPAAYLGSVSLLSIPAPVVLLIISSLMIFAGTDALLKTAVRKNSIRPSSTPGPGKLIIIGFATGFGSAITGTGGPLILVPIIVYLGLPVLSAIGLSQAIQIPIASFASVGNYVAGNLDVKLGLIIAASMVAGTFAGSVLIHRLPEKPVRIFVALLLVSVGLGIAFNLAHNVFYVGAEV